jgi:hypothetical protein
MTPDHRDDIADLVRRLGEGHGRTPAEPGEIERLRTFFGHHVVPVRPDAYILGKFKQHVEGDGHWPEDTTPDQYLDSLRETILDSNGAIYLTDDRIDGEWTIYFVGRVRRAWRGPAGSNRLVVIFNAERPLLITGFQPSRGDDYVDRQGGFWLYRP